MAMDEHALENPGGTEANEGAPGAEGSAPRALHPDFGDPENWHDLAERGTPRNG
jgi:hypothetical protein